jgi:hypothetical protein
VVNSGKLLVNNASGSGVGTGDSPGNKGTLGGKGTIAGAVTMGMGDTSEATLRRARTRQHRHPDCAKPAYLQLQRDLFGRPK